MKKLLSSIFILGMMCMLMTIIPVKASAEEIVADSTGHSFNSDWEEKYTFSGGEVFKYGYNTFLINEDYAHCNKKYSQTRLKNANGTFYANAALYTEWSKVDVTHAGTYIVYSVIGV